VRIRWPFAAALIAALLAAPSAMVVPRFVHWWHERAEAQQEAAADARMQRLYGDTMAAMYRMTLPASFKSCGPPARRPVPFRCWDSNDVAVRPATTAVEHALADVGASRLQGDCHLNVGRIRLCEITAQLGGRSVAARVGPQIHYRPEGHSTYYGSHVSLDVRFE